MKKWIASAMALVIAASGAAVAATAAPAADAPVLDGKTLVAFGDSLTALSSWSQLAAENLNMALVNAGIGGNTSADGLARFERDVAANDPDFVTIAFGTNDFVRLSGTQPKVSLPNFKKNIETIVDKVEALDAVPVLFTAPYVREDAYPGDYGQGGITAALDEYNAVIREVAAAKAVDLVDMRKMCADYELSEFLVADGVHLSDVGRDAYAATLTAYLEEHYRRDPSVPPVERPQRPDVEPGQWTKSIISFDPADWMEPVEGSIQAKNVDGALHVANTTGLWPDYHYSPSLDKGVNIPVEGSTLNFDFTTDGAGTNIVLFMNGSTPTLAYDQNYVSLPRVIKKFYPSLQLSGDDVVAGQTVKGSIPLSKLGIPASAIDEDGNVLFSGVKVFAVGAKGKPVIIRELSVTKTGDADPEPPAYEQIASLLPASADAVTPDLGVADVTLNEDGSLTLTRAAASDIDWPSVAYALDQEVDLSANPYLHLKMTPDGGTANGYLFYTDEEGQEHSVQISQMVYGSETDIDRAIDEYLNLSDKLGSTGKIRLTKITLSVYGDAGRALTWNDISLMKRVEKPAPTDPKPTDPTEPSVTDPSDPIATEPTGTDATDSTVSTDGTAATSATTGKGDNPKTGENTSWLLLGALTLAASAGVLLFTRKAKAR